MKAIGTRPFTTLATDANLNIFMKCILHLAQAKVRFAQMKVQQTPAFPLTSLETFIEMQLRILTIMSQRLPYPIAMYLKSIEKFTADSQPVVPIFSDHHRLL